MAFGLPAYKDIVDLLKKGATLEAQEKVMELREGALELQEENLRLKSELKAERENVGALEQKLAFRATFSFRKPFYFAENDPVPFCPVCWEGDRKTIHLDGPFGKNRSYWNCRICRNNIHETTRAHSEEVVEEVEERFFT